MDEEEQIVAEFAVEMMNKIKLRHNRYAPMGWKTMDVKRILMLLHQEIVEFDEGGEGRSQEAVDIANYACFLWAITKDKTLV